MLVIYCCYAFRPKAPNPVLKKTPPAVREWGKFLQNRSLMDA